MEQLQLIPKPAGGHSLSTDVLAALRPMRGLTFRRGDMEANVHDVHNGSVYWGVYAIGARNPTLLIRASEEDWESIAIRALTEGAEAFCLVDANAELRGRAQAQLADGPSSNDVLGAGTTT